MFELTESKRSEAPHAARRTAWQLDLTGVNAYLVDDGTVTLVDTGTPWGISRLVREIERTGHAVTDIDQVLLTHYDIDHVGGLRGLDRDIPVYLGTPDRGFLTGQERPPLSTPKGVLHRVVGPFLRDRDHVIEPVEDGDAIGSFKAYHTPGHTPGHMAYLSESLSIGFLGDLVIERKGELVPSPWYLSYDTDQVADSIRDLADRQPPIETVGVGHGVPFLKNGCVRLAELGRAIA
ncbi:MBL fold metallo-hydrolase [Halocatena pleomorpha]|uniref:MBL fold metallo-hydrolase n=1 Tax=Halocatena pleomorpha TaxID=1785090 RepID=UPI003742613B